MKVSIETRAARVECARLLRNARQCGIVTKTGAAGNAYTMATTLSIEAKKDGNFSEFRFYREIARGLESIALN